MSESWIAVRFRPGTEISILRKIYRDLDLFLVEDTRAFELNMNSDFKARVQRADADVKARQLQELDCVASVTIYTQPPVF